MINHVSAYLAARASMLALRKDQRGVTALEYGLMASLVAVAIIAGVKTFATSLSSTFVAISSSV